jgi:hypothetical protein
MLVLIALLLALIPAVAVLYPFLRRRSVSRAVVDEGSPEAELARRWDAALSGLKNAELEHAIGNLAQTDYIWLREQYMTEAALVMKAMDLELEQERDLLSSVRREIRSVRIRAVGPDEATVCPACAAPVEANAGECPECGRPMDGAGATDSDAEPPPEAPKEAMGG